MSRIYRTAAALFRAAQRVLGGRINSYDGHPVLTLTEAGRSGAIRDNHLSAHEAARRARLDYRPREE